MKVDRYCSHCGEAMTIALLGGRERHQCAACGFVLWKNPAPVGMALIGHEGRLVLIRRAAAPLAGYWAPPAGYVECGESVPDAVMREAREECGLEIVLDGLLGVYSQPDVDVDVIAIAYTAHATGGQLAAGDDAVDARLFARDDLPAQLPPTGGTATDLWFHAAITDCLVRWRETTPKE